MKQKQGGTVRYVHRIGSLFANHASVQFVPKVRSTYAGSSTATLHAVQSMSAPPPHHHKVTRKEAALWRCTCRRRVRWREATPSLPAVLLTSDFAPSASSQTEYSTSKLFQKNYASIAHAFRFGSRTALPPHWYLFLSNRRDHSLRAKRDRDADGSTLQTWSKQSKQRGAMASRDYG